MAKQEKSGPPWTKIKKEYLEGVPPRDLAKKYGLKPEQVSGKAKREKWKTEKSQIGQKIAQIVEEDLKDLKGKAIQELKLIAFSDLRKILSWQYGQVRLKRAEDISDDAAKCLAEVSETQTGIKVKLYNKLTALIEIINLCREDEKSSKPKKRDLPEDIKSMSNDELMDAITEYLE